MGGNWRMPTEDDFVELCLNTDIYLVPTEDAEIQGTVEETSGDGININWASYHHGTLKGIKFYKKGDKQTYMFVPAAGVAGEGSPFNVGQIGGLWASSLYSLFVQNAWHLYFNANSGGVSGNYRAHGFPVRGVLAQ